MAFNSIPRNRPSSASLTVLGPTSAFFRCYASEELLDRNGIENSKPKPSSEKATAKTMSALINSRPWSSRLESSLAELSPTLSKATVIQTLNLINDSSKAPMFFKWAQRMGFTHDELSFFVLLEILGRSRNLDAARNLLFSIEKVSGGSVKLGDKLFNSLIRSYGRAGFLHEPMKLFKAMKSLGVSPSVVTFNSLFSVLLKRGRTRMAKNLYDEMLGTYGVTPDTFTFNILIRGFSMNSMVDEGFHFFKEMARFDCEPDVVTYNTLVDGLCRAGKVGTARNVAKGMAQKNPDLNPNVVTYTTLIRGYCMKQEVDEALLVFKEMTSRGLKPNTITYNTLLKGLCEARKLEEMKEVLEGARRRSGGGFVPDTCTFNTLIHSHCRDGKLDEALKVFAEMKELKVQRDSASYSVLIGSLCREGNYGKAEELFDELSESEILSGDFGCRPLVASYNTMFEYLCRRGKTKKAEGVFRQMAKRGVQDPPAYKTLIMGRCKEGAFEAANELLVSMLRRDFVPDFEIYESLIRGLLRTGKALLANSTLEKMLKSSRVPRASTFHSVLARLVENGCAKQSAGVVALMLEHKVRQNITLSTEVVGLLFGTGLGDEAFELLGSLYENGYAVRIEELVGFLCRSRKLSEACKLLHFGLPRHRSFDIELFDKVISGLCEDGMVTEAFGLYYEMVESGVHEHLMCLEDLKTALRVAGKSSEAEFVSKRIPVKEQNRAPPSKIMTSDPEVREPNVSPLVIKRLTQNKTKNGKFWFSYKTIFLPLNNGDNQLDFLFHVMSMFAMFYV